MALQLLRGTARPNPLPSLHTFLQPSRTFATQFQMHHNHNTKPGEVSTRHSGYIMYYKHNKGEIPDMSKFEFPSTKYDPKYENLVANPPPGIPMSDDIHRKVFVLSAILFAIPWLIEPRAHKRYMKEHGHRYTEGWDLYHYSPLEKTPRIA
eukprot:Selendium_serpulae@DN2856_c0_g1_i1.p1